MGQPDEFMTGFAATSRERDSGKRIVGNEYSLTPDDWLSRMLGKPAYSLAVAESGQSIAELGELLRRKNLFVTAKIPASEIPVLHRLESIGFRVVDTSLRFQLDSVGEYADREHVRSVRVGDRERVIEIAERAFAYSRFHLDPMISKLRADTIKAEWVGNFFHGSRGDFMVVFESESLVGGFMLLIRSEDDLIIDLIAVDPACSRQGAGSAMIMHVAGSRITGNKRPKFIVAGTQAANIPSVNLYLSLGFRLAEVGYVLHHHGADS